MTDRTMAAAAWFDNAHPPSECGLYYHETCDSLGHPRPGLWLWEEGKPCVLSELTSKYFGPIRGAMQEWPMVTFNVKNPVLPLTGDNYESAR